MSAADAETQLAQITTNVLASTGQPPTIGVAGGKFTARVAAASLNPGESFVVPAGEEAAFLADYPATLLPIDGELLRQLTLLGLTTLGQIAALPVEAVVNRFGRAGRTLHRLATGRDSSPVAHYRPRQTEIRRQQFEQPVNDRVVLAAVLAHLARGLANEAALAGQAVREVGLQLVLEDGLPWEQTIVLREPVSSAEALIAAGRELLAAVQISQGVVEMALMLADFTPAIARQLSLFARSPVSQAELRDVLQGLIARYGADCFYWGRVVNQQARLPERRFVLEKVE